jgi:thimet oligopeptidase
VKDGLLAITSKMFGIKYKKAEDAPTWHPDVEAMEITDLGDRPIGRFYFDLYPRDGKYKHAAVFGIRDTAKMPDGSRLMPIAAIECNFPKPGGAAPALMSHQDAVTFFHEFGHRCDSDDAAKLVEKFLGRPPRDAAYKAFLQP